MNTKSLFQSQFLLNFSSVSPLWFLEPVLYWEHLVVPGLAGDVPGHLAAGTRGVRCSQQVEHQTRTVRQWEEDGALWMEAFTIQPIAKHKAFFSFI